MVPDTDKDTTMAPDIDSDTSMAPDTDGDTPWLQALTMIQLAPGTDIDVTQDLESIPGPKAQIQWVTVDMTQCTPFSGLNPAICGSLRV